jgi:class 3 adenylate cyclase
MAEARGERRLAAILAADVAGYSQMMGQDEEGTLAALKTQRAELIEPSIAKHNGRVVKLMGDGILAEFNSVVEAALCATEIQREVALHATGKRMQLRIGLHLGDIIIEGEDIYGDGVNIAARLEGIAEPGGICISRQAFDQIEGKLPVTWRPLGPQTLKNIPKLVDVYSADLAGVTGSMDPGQSTPKVEYCRAPDGVRLAYAKVGNGPPLVKTANWMNHLQYDWELPALRHLFLDLARDFTLLR